MFFYHFQFYEYGRSGNPTRDVLEKCLASLDGGKHSLTFSSGLGTTTIITQLLNAGDHVICCDDVYGGTNRLFSKVAGKHGIQVEFVDMLDGNNVRKALKPNTKVSYSSPTAWGYKQQIKIDFLYCSLFGLKLQPTPC